MSTRNQFYLIAFLFYIMNLATIYGDIFKDALFLSSYPPEWLSYLYLTTFVLNVAIFILIDPIIRKGHPLLNQMIVITLILIGLGGLAIKPFNYVWFPFAYTVYFSLLYPILSVILFNMASHAFHIRKFKKYTPKFRAAASVGMFVGSVSTPFLIQLFGSDSILYLALASLIILEVVLFFNPFAHVQNPPDIDENLEKIPANLWDYSILKMVFPMIVFMSTGYFISSYLLKNQLALEFNRDEISSFLGYLFAITYFITFIVQTFISPVVTHRYGVISMFLIAPTIIISGSILSIFYANVYSLAIYEMLVYLSFICFHILAFEMALSPLPLKVRVGAKMIEEGLLESMGQGVAALFFLIFTSLFISNEAVLIAVAIFSLAYCIPWYFMVKKAQGYYRTALEKAIEIRSFKPNDNPSLELQKSDELPLASLISQLNDDKKDESLWNLVKLLRGKENPKIFSTADEIFHKEFPPKKLYMIPLLAGSTDLKYRESLLESLEEGLKRREPETKLAALRALRFLNPPHIQDLLAPHYMDNSTKVALEAIYLAAKNGSKDWISSFLRIISIKDPENLYTRKALKIIDVLNHDQLSDLLRIIQMCSRRSILIAAVKKICTFKGKEAEKAIIFLAENKNSLVKSVVSYQALASASQTVRGTFHKKLIYDLIVKENEKVNALKKLLNASFPSYVKKEIKVKINSSILRMICWYGCYTHPEIVIKLIPLLRNTDFNQREASVRVHTTLELLSSLAPDNTLQYIFSTLEQDVDDKNLNESLKIATEDDASLSDLINYYNLQKEGGMDDLMSKLVLLREVKLFDKLSSDVLRVVANESKWRPMTKNEQIFAAGDEPDGVYMIASGRVAIRSKNKEITMLKELDFFGEVGLIDNTVRLADAFADEDGMLLYIDQVVFSDLMYEFPEMLKSVASIIITYLKKDESV